MNWQVNTQARAPGLKAWLKQNGSHAILASGRFDTAAKDEDEEASRMMNEMGAEARRNS